MGLLGLVVLLMVVRPLVRRILTPEERSARWRCRAGGRRLARRQPPTRVTAEAPMPPTREPSQTAKMIDIAQVQGQVHAQSVQKVGELADKNPSEAVSIIRQWLNESAAA